VLLAQTVENSGQLFDVPAWLVGWAPTALLVVLTAALLLRAR
jgi:hypothetical protein